MASKFKKRKSYIISIIVILAIVLIAGIKSTYAYYYDKDDNLAIFSGLIGDFDSGKGDINIMIYKETGKGTGNYVRSFSVPDLSFFSFDDQQTVCSNPITHMKIEECKKDESGNCYYSFDESNKQFSLTSNQKVTCKFYFKQNISTDIDIIMYKQDENGEVDKDGVKYTQVESIPSEGFTYSSKSNCESGSQITNESGSIKVTAPNQDKCYIYYDKNQ